MQQKKKQDWILILAFLALGAGLIFGGKFFMGLREAEEGLKANIYELTSDGRKLLESFTLKEGEQAVYEFHGKLGVTVVEIDGLKVRVRSSPCPDQVCVQFGWLQFHDDFAACLPNSMIVVLEGDGVGY